MLPSPTIRVFSYKLPSRQGRRKHWICSNWGRTTTRQWLTKRYTFPACAPVAGTVLTTFSNT
jgi:hypothetical protein